MNSEWSRHWGLDPVVDFLNHGSFGACPLAVQEAQRDLRDRMERQPVQFFARDLEPLVDAARAALAAFVGADAEDLAFVTNATTGVNTVLRSLRFAAGDDLLTTDHAYAACRNALDRTARQAGARVVTARVPFPLDSPRQVVDAVLGALTPRTRLVLLDHVTSPTGLVWPAAEIVARLRERGIDTLVDGAHAPGMLPLDLRGLGAAYYTANCHKWLCTPRGAAFLHVRRDRREFLHPLVTSHGATSPRTDRSRFHLEFDWTGTHDPTPYLVIPAAIGFLGALLPGGWPEVMQHNRALAIAARQRLCRALGVGPPAPEEMIGSMTALPLPPGDAPVEISPAWLDPLQQALVEEHAIEVPVFAWPEPPARLLRVSAQLYNSAAQYDRLARALVELLGR